jgi:hypothetical protein
MPPHGGHLRRLVVFIGSVIDLPTFQSGFMPLMWRTCCDVWSSSWIGDPADFCSIGKSDSSWNLLRRLVVFVDRLIPAISDRASCLPHVDLRTPGIAPGASSSFFFSRGLVDLVWHWFCLVVISRRGQFQVRLFVQPLLPRLHR